EIVALGVGRLRYECWREAAARSARCADRPRASASRLPARARLRATRAALPRCGDVWGPARSRRYWSTLEIAAATGRRTKLDRRRSACPALAATIADRLAVFGSRAPRRKLRSSTWRSRARWRAIDARTRTLRAPLVARPPFRSADCDRERAPSYRCA